MLDEMCAYLNNWFDRDWDGKRMPRSEGRFAISGGALDMPPGLVAEGQHYRITGSLFNDGVHKHPAGDLADEEFDGAVQSMALPMAVAEVAGEIAKWMEKYGGHDSPANSPYNSESFGGYSYSKSYRNASVESDGLPPWAGAFAGRLERWRRLR